MNIASPGFTTLFSILILLCFLVSCKSNQHKSTNLLQQIQAKNNLSIVSGYIEQVGDFEKIIPKEINQYTIVLPSDKAFNVLGAGILDNIRAPYNQEKRISILQAHIIPEKISSKSELKKYQGMTLSGKPLNFKKNAATIIEQLKIPGGKIFIIDKVLQR